MKFKHILAATDFSDFGQAAVGAAVDLAKQNGAALTLVHVVEIPTYAYAGMDVPVDLVTPVAEAARAAMQKALDTVQLQIPSARAKLEPSGVPWQRILAVAEQVNADLIVVGTHGRTGLRHALIGSVAERVVRHAHVPVLTIRRPEG
jgi:nucleotide-binding universal stress UspA family protein